MPGKVVENILANSLAMKPFRRAAYGARGVSTPFGYVLLLELDIKSRGGFVNMIYAPSLVVLLKPLNESLPPGMQHNAYIYNGLGVIYGPKKRRLDALAFDWRMAWPTQLTVGLQAMEDIAHSVLHGAPGPEWAA